MCGWVCGVMTGVHVRLVTDTPQKLKKATEQMEPIEVIMITRFCAKSMYEYLTSHQSPTAMMLPASS